MGAAGEAVGAGVLAAAVGVDAIDEAEAGGVGLVDDGLAFDLFEDDAGSHTVLPSVRC